jgi:uridine kinase
VISENTETFKYPLVIAVAGGSGSGKTTLCRKIIKIYGEDRIAYLSLDSFYHDLSHLTVLEKEQHNYDHPDSIDIISLEKALTDLKSSQDTFVPIYDFLNHERKREKELVSSRSIILLDGILLYHYPAIVRMLDIKIFLHVPDRIRLDRRVKRDTLERGRSVESIVQQIKSSVQPMFEKYVLPSRTVADIIIDNHSNYAPIYNAIHRHLMTSIVDTPNGNHN